MLLPTSLHGLRLLTGPILFGTSTDKKGSYRSRGVVNQSISYRRWQIRRGLHPFVQRHRSKKIGRRAFIVLSADKRREFFLQVSKKHISGNVDVFRHLDQELPFVLQISRSRFYPFDDSQRFAQIVLALGPYRRRMWAAFLAFGRCGLRLWSILMMFPSIKPFLQLIRADDPFLLQCHPEHGKHWIVDISCGRGHLVQSIQFLV